MSKVLSPKLVYSIKDTIMDEFNDPFIANNDSHASVIFESQIARAKKAGYRSEFELYCLGTWYPSDGELNEHVPAKVNPVQLDLDFEENN